MIFYLSKPYVKQYFSYPLSTPPLPLSSIYPNTMKGEVLKAIIMKGSSISWKELQNTTGLNEKSLNYALYQLIESKEIFKVGRNYEVSKKLHDDYQKTFGQLGTDLDSWIIQWKRVKNLDFSLKNRQFFLEGRHLDDFTKELISHAKSEVVIVNPFIQECDLSNTLREVKKQGIEVQIITRPPKDNYPNRLQQKQDFHNKLKQDGLSIIYKAKVHAKITIVDRTVAIVSSMNFYPESSAGVSWEAGLITTDEIVVESMVKSILTKFI